MNPAPTTFIPLRPVPRSGVLTEEEFQAEKKRILAGN